jgi:hypothetical protein
MEIKKTSDVTNTKIKILVHGLAGSGKTRLCATAKNPIILSAESGLLSLQDFDLPYIEIANVDDLRAAYAFLSKDTSYDWVCIDSISEIAEVVLSSEKAKTKDPRKAYGEMQDVMMGLLRSFRDLDKNVYFSAKQDKVKDEATGMFFYGPSAPGTKIGPAMPYLFDEVFALHAWKDDEGNLQSALQTQRCAQYDAKDRSGRLDFQEPADLDAILTKIKQPKEGK